MSLRTLAAILAVGLFSLSPVLRAADHAVILLYHHVSQETPASTSVTPERFTAHLDYLEDHGFTVMPLQLLLEKALAGGPLPDNAVAITFDDAYRSVFTEAAPRLADRDWPFTVFLASQPLDDQVPGYMSWQQARELLAMGASIGGHSHSHDYLARRRSGESDAQWAQRIDDEIDRNRERIRAEMQVDIQAFAYPFGEYNSQLKGALSRRQLLGLAQQSGAVGAVTDPLQIPRFPMASGQDSLQRLRQGVHSRPLPVVQERVDDGVLSITLSGEALAGLACFASSGEALSLHQMGERRYAVDLPPTRGGRNKVNCTAPSSEGAGEFYWYSYLWLGD